LYLLDSRNLAIGVYTAEQKGFIGIRVKFSSNFLFVEHHWDCGPPCGTAKPLKFLELYPFEDITDGWKAEGRWGWRENDTMYSWLEEKEVLYGDEG
jgi:hypothetical protein